MIDNPFLETTINEIFSLKENGYLHHRESTELEYKEQFNHSGWDEYLRDFAAFSNNNGGYIIFGIRNSPRIPIEISEKSLQMFEEIDEEYISGEINKLFAPSIKWEKTIVDQFCKKFPVFYIYANTAPPVIACDDSGVIKNGEIYFRYGGRSQKIQFAELNNIIEKRVLNINKDWLNLMNRIGKVGPANAAILDTEKGLIENNNNVLVVDETLLPKIKFIREGNFNESGATTLKLVGEVSPVSTLEVTKVLEKNILEKYPLSCVQLITEIQKELPRIGKNRIYEAIKENKIKGNRDYSSYNFRNKSHEEKYKKDGIIMANTPVIYNQNAVKFLVKVLKR